MNRPPDIGYLLNKATRLLRLQLAEALSDSGLTPQQTAVIMAIAHSEAGHLTPSAIAASIDTDQATTSGLLERLTRDGWLHSTPNPDDGRSRLIGLTAKANSALPQLLEAADRVSAQATTCLSAQEIATLSTLLERLCAPPLPADKKAVRR
ncbi:MAG: MarR family winged helix-turn-helix transcriptional regulator [Coriobacteriia bacterium]